MRICSGLAWLLSILGRWESLWSLSQPWRWPALLAEQDILYITAPGPKQRSSDFWIVQQKTPQKTAAEFPPTLNQASTLFNPKDMNNMHILILYASDPHSHQLNFTSGTLYCIYHLPPNTFLASLKNSFSQLMQGDSTFSGLVIWIFPENIDQWTKIDSTRHEMTLTWMCTVFGTKNLRLRVSIGLRQVPNDWIFIFEWTVGQAGFNCFYLLVLVSFIYVGGCKRKQGSKNLTKNPPKKTDPP